MCGKKTKEGFSLFTISPEEEPIEPRIYKIKWTKKSIKGIKQE